MVEVNNIEKLIFLHPKQKEKIERLIKAQKVKCELICEENVKAKYRVCSKCNVLMDLEKEILKVIGKNAK